VTSPDPPSGRKDAPPAPGALAAPPRPPPEVVAEIRGALVEARVAAEQRAAHGPLRDLAEALRSNAEALRAIQETQERIARTVDRADRSEAVIQSTQALNDTFRGVRATQEALVTRLEEEERRPLRYGIAAAALVAATAAAAAWWFVRREDGLRGRIEDLRAGMGTADREAWERSRREAEKDLLDRLESLSRQSSLSEADRSAREKDLLALKGSLEALRRDGDALAVRRGQMEAEVARLRQDNASLRSELEVQRRASEEAARALREREARELAVAAAPPAPVPAMATLAPPSSPGQEPGTKPPASPDPPAAPRLGPTAVTDQGQVRKVLDDLNALLERGEGVDRYRVLSSGAVDGDRLVRATLESRGADGAVRRSFEAAEARFVLQAASRSLEIRLRGGSVTYLGRRTVRFPDDRYTAYIEVDPEVFKASGNPLISIQ